MTNEEMTNEEFAFNYAGKEFMHYGNRVALVGCGSENPPVEIRTDGTLEELDVPHEPVDPRPRTIGELIKELEDVRGIQFLPDETAMFKPLISAVSTEV